MPELLDLIEVIRGGRYVILDTETTSLIDGEICQIAIIDAHGKVLLDTFVKTIHPIPADATAIHGITDEAVANSPSWALLVPLLIEMLRDKDLIVWNAVYDRKMFHQSSEKSGIDKIAWKEIARWHCAMEGYAEYYGDWNSYRGNFKWQKLSDAYRRCTSNDQPMAHSALSDCKATLEVLRCMDDNSD